MSSALAALALGAGGVVMTAAQMAELVRYTITNHPPNPLSPDAARNLAWCRGWIDRAVAAVGGTLTSAYRSPRVNDLIGGAPNSDHMKGLAADISPGKPHTPTTQFELYREMHARGELGPIRQLILEPTWCHIGWHRPDATGPIKLLRKTPTGFEVVT